MLLKIMNRIRGTTYYTDGYDLYNGKTDCFCKLMFYGSNSWQKYGAYKMRINGKTKRFVSTKLCDLKVTKELIIVPIPEFKNWNNCFISRNGEVFNFVKMGWAKQRVTPKKYKVVSVNNSEYLVHKLVAEAYLKKEFDFQEVDHINRIRFDNRVTNLHYALPSENMDNRVEQKRQPRYVNVNGNIVFCPSKRSYSAFVKRKGGD